MSGWEVRFSNSRKTPYFYNAQTQQSTWEPPAGMSDAEISALPGAKYLTGGGEAGQVRASHILAKHAGSRRPSSWKQVSRCGGLLRRQRRRGSADWPLCPGFGRRQLPVRSSKADFCRIVSRARFPRRASRSRRTSTTSSRCRRTSRLPSSPRLRAPRATAPARARAATWVGSAAARCRRLSRCVTS